MPLSEVVSVSQVMSESERGCGHVRVRTCVHVRNHDSIYGGVRSRVRSSLVTTFIKLILNMRICFDAIITIRQNKYEA